MALFKEVSAETLRKMSNQYAKRLETIENEFAHDPEAAHSRSDDLLGELLTELGFKRIVEIFERIEKWYA